MRSTLLLILTLAAVRVFASDPPYSLSLMDDCEEEDEYVWSVTHWEAGCERQGCHFLFNISGPATDIVPAFFAYCSGYQISQSGGSDYRACRLYDADDGPAGRVVAAKLRGGFGQGTGAHLSVSYRFNDLMKEGFWYNYTSLSTQQFNQFVTPPQSFTLNITEFFGVG